MSTRQRQQAERKGRWAETLCVLVLRLKGYRILARNWRVPSGEADIIARQRRVLVFVEVKSRMTTENALYAIHEKQQRRITSAAGAWLGQHPECANMHVRFDVMAVAPWRYPKHIRAAWGHE